jgi:hypothetical protein
MRRHCGCGSRYGLLKGGAGWQAASGNARVVRLGNAGSVDIDTRRFIAGSAQKQQLNFQRHVKRREFRRGPSGPMIRMVRQETHRAIQLLGDDQPHQHVRQCERTERPCLVRCAEHLRCMPFRTPDQEREVATLLAPVLHALRELFGRVHLPGAIERDPSSLVARAVSRPLPRVPGAISIRSSGSQCDRRFA